MDNTSYEHRKRHLENQLLKIEANSIQDAQRELAEIWKTVTRATSTAIWTRRTNNQETDWQPVGISPGKSPALLNSNSSVVELALARQCPLFVRDLTAWQEKNGTCQILAAGLDISSTSLLAIPFPNDIDEGNHPTFLKLSGAICCHFDDEAVFQAVRDEISDQELMSLMRISVSHLRSSIAEQQLRILVELNMLSSGLLTKITKSPRTDRRLFLGGVAELLRKSIGTKAVSVFYRRPLSENVTCIYSDGLCQSNGEVIHKDSLANCGYRPGEGDLGTVFGLGERAVKSAGESRAQKYYDVIAGQKLGDEATLLEPIPLSDIADQFSESKSEGVIRCVGWNEKSPYLNRKSFSDLEVQVVHFVASQIAPVLKQLQVRIQREDQVNIVRHDLLVPARMISDSVEELVEVLGEEENAHSSIHDYLLPDIAVASKLLTNLVLQLDAEPGIPYCAPRMTLIARNIVVRNKYMWTHYAKSYNNMTLRIGDLDREIPALWVDKELVERALFNVVINAIKYGQAESEILIAARSDSECFYVDIKNVGMGIELEDQSRIFERYYRGMQKNKVEGMGLGLYISKAAMEKTGGALILTNRKNPTVFSFVFPRILSHRNSLAEVQ